MRNSLAAATDAESALLDVIEPFLEAGLLLEPVDPAASPVGFCGWAAFGMLLLLLSPGPFEDELARSRNEEEGELELLLLAE